MTFEQEVPKIDFSLRVFILTPLFPVDTIAFIK
jgi:hypothetical protein